MAKLFKRLLKRKTNRPNQPKLLILGAQKAGTTTLFDMLDGVGPFRGSSTKEVGFFSKDMFYERGMTWYLTHFTGAVSDHIGFEATPEYLFYNFVAKRIHEHLPDARFVVLLREPASRCFSAWNMFRTFNRDQPQAIYDHFTQFANPEAREPIKRLLFADVFPSFEACIDSELAAMDDPTALPEPSFVRRGLYAQQLEVYFKLFGRNRFLFLEQSELNDPFFVAAAVGKLMGIKLDPSNFVVQASNQGEYSPSGKLFDATMTRLREFYKPHNEQLFHLIGREFNW